MLKDNSTLMHIKQHLQEKKTNNQIHDMQATARYKFIDQPTVGPSYHACQLQL